MSNLDLVNKLPDSIYAITPNSNIYKLWKIFAHFMDEIDKLFSTMALMSDIQNNYGGQLDLVGKILRCYRRGQGDANYLSRLLVATRKYQSNGSVEDLNEICDILLGDKFKHINDMNREGLYGESKFLDGTSFLDGSFFLAGSVTRPRFFEVVISSSLDNETVTFLSDIISSCKGGGIKFVVKMEN